MRAADLLARLFAPEREVRSTWLARGLLGLLFAAGLAGWSFVMGWGRASLDFHDWTVINLPRLLFLQNALHAGEWPLHMAGNAPLHGLTDRFLALPDVITSPQTVLLLFMPVTRFVLIDVLLHFSAGFGGLLLLRRYLQWSLFAFALVFLTFLFNGHILAHYSVGHFTWGSYFVFPYVAWFVLRFLDGDDSWRSVACFAMLMFYMVLAGGEHHMTWVLLLLGLLAPFCGRRAWWPAAVAISSVLLSAVRLLPPALELQSFHQAGLIADVVGYPSVSHLISSLIVLRRETPSFVDGLPGNLWFFDSAYYEFNVYLGAVGFVLLVTGLWLWLRSATPAYRALVLPIFAMTALCLGSVYRVVRMASIPLLDGERYTARMFALPLFLMIVMAAVALDRRLKQPDAPLWHRILACVALLFVAIDTVGSIRLWRVGISSGLFGASALDASAAAVVRHADPSYQIVVLAGVALSVAAAVTLAVLVRRERQRAIPTSRA